MSITDIKIYDNRRLFIEVKKGKLYTHDNQRVLVPIDLTISHPYRILKKHFLWNIRSIKRYRPDEEDEESRREYNRMRELDYYLDRIYSTIENYFSDYIFYLGPLRDYPQRYYISSGDRPRNVGLRGENTANILYLDRKSTVITDIQHWLNVFDMSTDLRPTGITTGIWRIDIKDKDTGVYSNIKDVGFGISQLLPIIVQTLSAPKGSMFIIEQPEIHLHPKNQAQLADLFIEISKQEKYSVIETHSEHMIQRFGTRIAEGELNHEDICIFEFVKTKKGTEIHEINYDEFGNLEKWPAGFFDTELNETLAHIKAMTGRKIDETRSSA